MKQQHIFTITRKLTHTRDIEMVCAAGARKGNINGIIEELMRMFFVVLVCWENFKARVEEGMSRAAALGPASSVLCFMFTRRVSALHGVPISLPSTSLVS